MSNTPLPSSFDHDTEFYEENRWQKFSRRLREEPLIPLGCGLTCYALFGATRSMRRGDHNTTNRMFRARIYAQAFTLVAVVAGSMYYKQDRVKRKEFEGAVAERKAKEKSEAWIRELEVRDEEDRALRAMRDEARGVAAARRGDGEGVRQGPGRKVVEIGEVKSDGEGMVEIGEARGDRRITDAVKGLVQGRK